jgi:hypothetical protein
MLDEDVLQVVMNVEPANYMNIGRHLKFKRVCKAWNRVSKQWLCVYVKNMEKCATYGLHEEYRARDTVSLLRSIQLYPLNHSISISGIEFLLRIYCENNSSSRDIVRKDGIAIFGKLIKLNETLWKDSRTIFLAVLMLWTFCIICKENEVNIIEMANQNTIDFMIDLVEKSEDNRVIKMSFDIIDRLCYRSEYCQNQALLKNGIEVVACKTKKSQAQNEIVREGCRLIGTMSCITMPPVNIAKSSAIGVLVMFLKKNNMHTQNTILNVLLKLQKDKHNKKRIAHALGQSTIRIILHNQHTHNKVRRKCMRLHRLVCRK